MTEGKYNIMHTSTKEYVKRCLWKIMGQCAIDIDDVQVCVNELKMDHTRDILLKL